MAFEKHEYVHLEDDEEVSQRVAHAQRAIKRWRFAFFVLLGCFAVSSLTCAYLIRQALLEHTARTLARNSDVIDPYSPAEALIEYENRWLSRDPETHRFMGKPRPELDQAWHELLNGTLIKISEEELEQADHATSVRHKDGGYVAGLGISHSLHCLKRLKQYMHPDYYYSTPGQDWDELEKHADHCLEGLRQSAMCQADLSVYTLEWTPHSRYKPTVRVPQPHTCVNFEKVHEWMKDRLATNLDMVPAPEELYEQNDTT